MEYISIFFSWFLDNFTSPNIPMVQVFATLTVSSINAMYIYCVYRVLGRKTIYSKRIGITVSSISVVTTAIVFTVHSSMVLSLGVVGALSIVRFRTAFKEALDIVFLFWSVTVGLCYGAHMGRISVILSAFLTILIFYLDSEGKKQECRLLIMESEDVEFEKAAEIVKAYSKRFHVRTKMSEGNLNRSVVEIVTKNEYEIIKELRKISGVREVSIIEQNGEHCF